MNIREIHVPVKEVEKNSMMLTQHLGDGTLGETEFDASFALPNFSLIVSVNGRRFMVQQQHVIQAIIELVESKKI